MTIIYRVANGDLEYPKTSLPLFWQKHLCFCSKFKITPDMVKQYSWWKDRNLQLAPDPIGCGTCGKWPRSSIRRCNTCGIIFYKQYRTYLMPLRWDLDYCWPCLHEHGASPPWNTHPWFVGYQDARPPDCVIPPPLSKAEVNDLFKL